MLISLGAVERKKLTVDISHGLDPNLCGQNVLFYPPPTPAISTGKPEMK